MKLEVKNLMENKMNNIISNKKDNDKLNYTMYDSDKSPTIVISKKILEEELKKANIAKKAQEEAKRKKDLELIEYCKQYVKNEDDDSFSKEIMDEILKKSLELDETQRIDFLEYVKKYNDSMKTK